MESIKNYIYNSKIKLKVIAAFVILSPIIDIIYSINYFVLKNNFPIHQIIRFILVAYFFMDIKEKKSKWFLWIITTLLIVGFIYQFVNGYVLSITENIGYILKILNTIVVTLSFYEYLLNKEIKLQQLFKYICLATLLISSNIVISNLFKIGFATYGESWRKGYKGLFIVHNSITATLAITLPLIIYYIIKYKKYLYGIIFVLNNMALLFIGTKAGMGASILVALASILAIFLYYRKDLNQKVNRIVYLIIIIGLLLIIFLLKGRFSQFWSEQENLFNDIAHGNLFSYILNNRNLQAYYMKQYIINNFSFNPIFLFGLGYSFCNEIIHKGKAAFKAIEIDWTGLMYYSGVWIAIAIFASIGIIFAINVYRFKKSINRFLRYTLIFCIILGLAHSLLAGHVIYEAISGTYFGFVLAISLFINKMDKENVPY